MNLNDARRLADPADALLGPRTTHTPGTGLDELLARVQALSHHGAAAHDRAGWALITGLARRASTLQGPARTWLCQRLERQLARWPTPHTGPCPAASAASGLAVPAPRAADPSARLDAPANNVADPGPAAAQSPNPAPRPPHEPAPTGATWASALGPLLDRLGVPASSWLPAATAMADAPSGQAVGLNTAATGLDQAAATCLDGAPQGAPHPATRTPPPELKTLRQFRGSWQRLRSDQRLRRALATVPEQAGPLNSQHLVLRLLTQLQALSPAALDHCLSHLDALAWLEDATSGALPLPGQAPAADSRPAKSRRATGPRAP